MARLQLEWETAMGGGSQDSREELFLQKGLGTRRLSR